MDMDWVHAGKPTNITGEWAKISPCQCAGLISYKKRLLGHSRVTPITENRGSHTFANKGI